MWETRLGGRIEASSALSVIHKLIVVGKFIGVLELLIWQVINFLCCIFAICIKLGDLFHCLGLLVHIVNDAIMHN